jgi:2-iminoacetate synthase
MRDFHVADPAIRRILDHPGDAAHDPDAILSRAARHEGLSVDDMGALWTAPTLGSDLLYRTAREIRKRRGRRLETFSPLYLTNTCDAECRMCGMRRDNDVLVRETASPAQAIRQLETLVRRGVRGVAILTGEYRAATRPWALALVNQVLRATQELGFGHVLINVGAVDAPEYDTLLAGLARDDDGAIRPRVTMCTFQESYSRAVYAKFMGTNPENPRADFDRRVTNFDRAHRAGLRVANPGILVGLNPDLGYELVALALHARHLRAKGMDVYLSVPRLRQIAGRGAFRGASDTDFIRLVAILSMGLPDCKIVITTREAPAMQHTLAPIISVISAGSSAVAPYTDAGARFPLEASQFEVIDQRPFEAILQEHLTHGGAIENFSPAPGSA